MRPMFDVLTQAGNAVDLARKAYDLSKKAGLVELQETLVSLREYTVDLREEILRLREEVKHKDEALALRRSLKYDKQMYWLEQEGGKLDGPYCQRCYDVRGLLVRLFSFSREDRYWRCAECSHLLER